MNWDLTEVFTELRLLSTSNPLYDGIGQEFLCLPPVQSENNRNYSFLMDRLVLRLLEADALMRESNYTREEFVVKIVQPSHTFHVFLLNEEEKVLVRLGGVR